MSTYADRLAAIRAAHAAADRDYPPSSETWRQARHAALARTLLDAVGTDDLPADEARYVTWLSGWDAETVAGVAALLDRARKGR